MDVEKKNQAILDHGWRNFEFHARQRLNIFNFYIILCGLLLSAWASVLTGQNRLALVGVLLGVLLAVCSVLFWKMDERNAHITKGSERVMANVEERMFEEQDFIFAGPEADKSLRRGWRFLLARQWSHGQSLRVLFALMGVAGLLAALFAGWQMAQERSGVGTQRVVGRSHGTSQSSAPTPPPSSTPR